MSSQILENLKTLIQSPNLASKKWISQQYDSQVMNDTIQTDSDAAIVRVHGTNKGLALTTDCTPRYVDADAFEGAKQAVAETYRNISAVGARPLAITNCLNFGNPQKPEIMGQIVRAINGITEACKVLDYPVVSGNVSLYNETDGKAIQPAPAIGGVGLLKNVDRRCDPKFKVEADEIFVIGETLGHISCSLYESEILKIESKKNPPIVNLITEKNHSEFVRELIENSLIHSCHDISDGGLLVSLFEMSTKSLGCEIDLSELKALGLEDENQILFAEDQSRYVVAIAPEFAKEFRKMAEKKSVPIFKVGVVTEGKISIFSSRSNVEVAELENLNEAVFVKKFS